MTDQKKLTKEEKIEQAQKLILQLNALELNEQELREASAAGGCIRTGCSIDYSHQ